MTPPDDLTPDVEETADGEMLAAMREARSRFIAAFSLQTASIEQLIEAVAAGQAAARADLRHLIHRMAGLGGTIGFPTVSERASALEQCVRADGALDSQAARGLLHGVREAFVDDLTRAPEWSVPAHGGTRGLSILVVEDDLEQLALVAGYLKAAGHRPRTLSTGEGVIEQLRVERPAVVLLDVELPGMDGFAICRQIKADPDLSALPVMFLTTRQSLDDRLTGLTLGADDFLAKPVDLRELKLRLERLAAGGGPVAAPASEAGRELTYEAFLALAAAHLETSTAALALLRVPPDTGNALELLHGEIRRRDILGRYSATHVLVLLSGMTAAHACARMTSIVETISKGRAGVAAGVAASAAPGDSLQRLIAEADEALAEAKYLGLPAAVRSTSARVAPAVAAAAVRSVVLADDDPDVIRIVDAQMRADGFRTTVAFDGEQALKAVQQGGVDVLVLDLMMPKMTGFDVLARIRALPSRPRIVVLSGRGREEDVTKAFALGADDYMNKPFSPQELRARIARLLR
ncbi:MAG: response regulator [Vicinamibacterales bacterium]